MKNIINRNVNYLSGDFSSFRNNLINYAKIYFPNTYMDFNESDPGTMFIEMAAYVGDVLNYYINDQLKEMMLPYARERRNVINIAQTMGYKPPTSITSTVPFYIYQLLPSKKIGDSYYPDFDYSMTVEGGLTVNSSTMPNIVFTIKDNIDFSFSSSFDPTEVNVYKMTNNVPEYYLIRKQRNGIAGNIKTETFTFGNPQKFPKISLTSTNIIEILDVVDSEGNNYYEVPYLSQDTIYEDVPNISIYDQYLSQYNMQVPFLLRTKRVSRRYTTKILADNTIEIQFGGGVSNTDDEIIIPNPDNIGTSLPFGNQVLNSTLDPNNFLYTKSYGLAPSNTTLTVRYLYGGGMISNVPFDDLTSLGSYSTRFNGAVSNNSLTNFIKNSLAVTNPESATGGRGILTTDEIKINALAYFSSQDRCVTDKDYAIRIKSMPGKYGHIAKVYVSKNNEFELKNNFIQYGNSIDLNIYCLSYDNNGNLTLLNDAIKENIKVYLKQYKMLSDGINIRDAYIINIGVDFEIMVYPNEKEPNVVLLNALDTLKSFFNIKQWEINEPININDIVLELAKVKGVQSVVSVNITNLYGDANGYSNNVYDIKSATRNNICYPSLDPSCFEVKYPDVDIRGKIVSV